MCDNPPLEILRDIVASHRPNEVERNILTKVYAEYARFYTNTRFKYFGSYINFAKRQGNEDNQYYDQVAVITAIFFPTIMLSNNFSISLDTNPIPMVKNTIKSLLLSKFNRIVDNRSLKTFINICNAIELDKLPSSFVKRYMFISIPDTVGNNIDWNKVLVTCYKNPTYEQIRNIDGDYTMVITINKYRRLISIDDVNRKLTKLPNAMNMVLIYPTTEHSDD